MLTRVCFRVKYNKVIKHLRFKSVCVLQRERLLWVHVCSFKEKKQGREKTSERAR